MAGVKGRSGGARPNSGGARSNAGGARLGAGRKRKPAAINAHADPLAFLRAVWTGQLDATALQVRAATAALAYVHPKRGEAGKKERAAESASRAARGRFKGASPPLALVKPGTQES